MSFESTRETLQDKREAVSTAERTVRTLEARISELEARRNALERGFDSHRLPPVADEDEAAADVNSAESVGERIVELRNRRESEGQILTEERTEVETLSEEAIAALLEGSTGALDDDVPIALFPVRLETRYDADANDLLVRVYPDQIHYDSHEPELTQSEVASAREFWQAVYLSGKGNEIDTNQLIDLLGGEVWAHDHSELLGIAVDERPDELHTMLTDAGPRSDDTLEGRFDRAGIVDFDDIGLADDVDVDAADPSDAEVRHAARCREAWKRLADEYGPERAGWIVRAYRPTEASTLLSTPFEQRPDVPFIPPSEGSVERRGDSWTRPARAALLPDYWTVSVYDDDLRDPAIEIDGESIPEELSMGPTPGEMGETLSSIANETTDEGLQWAVDFDAAVDVGMGIRVDLDHLFDPDDPPEQMVIDRLVVTGTKGTMDAQAGASAVRSLFDAHQYTDGLEFLPQGTPTNNTKEEAAGRNDSEVRIDRLAALACGDAVCNDDGTLSRTTSDTDGELLAKALAITPSASGIDDNHVFGRVIGAGGTEQRDARHMNTLLWEGTWGNYVRHLLPPDTDGLRGLERKLVDLRTEGLEVALEESEAILDDRVAMIRLLDIVQGYQHHFIDYVRARGPLPVLRVGDQPYGVLPTAPRRTPLKFDNNAPTERAAWRRTHSIGAEDGEIADRIRRRINTLTSTWSGATTSTPRLGRADASVAELYELLGMEPTSFGVFTADLVADNILSELLFESLRLKDKTKHADFDRDRDGFPWEGEIDLDEFSWNDGDIDPRPEVLELIAPLLDNQMSIDEVQMLLSGSIQEVSDAEILDKVQNLYTDGGSWRKDIVDQPKMAGLGWLPKISIYFGVGHSYKSLTPTRYDPPKVAPDGRERPEPTPLVADEFRSYVQTFLTEPPAVGEVSGDSTQPAPDNGWGAIDQDDLFYPLLRYSVCHAYLAAEIRQGYLSSDNYRYSPPSASEFESTAASRHSSPDDPDLQEVMDGLQYFDERKHSPETVDRLLTETLDLASHRHDAWETSLATRRLDELRAGSEPGDAGLHVGGYGWVEDLRLDGSPSTLGYVDGPSLDHATTAAILRNGYLEYGDRVGEDAPENFEEMAELLSVSLTSRRVRLGRQILDGIRNGQKPADLFGYRFERALHDHGPDLALDRFIADFRRAYPPVGWENPGTDPDAVPPVVNGRALAEAWRRRQTDVFAAEGLEELASQSDMDPERSAVIDALDLLFDALDAVRDLLLAESVHQLAKGDNTRAAAALDALRGEGAPPELDVIRTPRAAQSVTHRVLLLFDPTERPETGWPTGRDGEALDRPNVKGFAEPTVDGWAGTLLGDPSNTVCQVEYAASPADDAAVFATTRVTLADLDLSPLDVLSLVGGESGTSDFEAYVRYHLGPTTPDGVPSDATVRLSTTGFDGLAADERSVAETFEFARSVRSLVRNGRPATARDLLLPDEGAEESVTAHSGQLGVRARTLVRDTADIESGLSTLGACLGGEPDPDAPETAVLGIASLSELVDTAVTTADDGVRKTVTAVGELDATGLETEVSELLAVIADLETEHTDRPPAASAVSTYLAGQSFPELTRLLAVPEVVGERLAATLDAVEAVHEGRDGSSLETLLTADATPLRAETYATLDDEHVAAVRATLAALAPTLPALTDDHRSALATLTGLNSVEAFVSLGSTPDEEVWAALSLDEVRAELAAVKTTLEAGGFDDVRTATGTYADFFAALETLAAEDALAPIRGAIQRDLRALLLRASYYGVTGAVPAPADDTAPTTTDEALPSQVSGVRETLRERLSTATLGDDPTIATYLESIETLLGDEIAVLPPFSTPNAQELAPAFDEGHQATLTGGDDLAVETWFHRMSRVRDGVDRLRRSFTYAEALSDDATRSLNVGQLPFVDDDRWVALPIDPDADRDLNGRLSLVVGTDPPAADTDTLTGLLVDEWTEPVPEPTTTAGASFQYDAPGSRAPQSVLLCVPTAEGWNPDTFRDTVTNTFELAKRRTVDFNDDLVGDDPSSPRGLDRLFPAIGILGLATPEDPPIVADLSHLDEVQNER